MCILSDASQPLLDAGDTLLEQYTLFVVYILDATRLTVDFTADLMISDIIRRPPEPLAYLCIAVLLAGSLAPAVDRAPSGRRCRKQETRLFEQYTFLQSTGWATPVSPWTPPPNLMISDIIRRPPSLWPICA